MQIETMTIAGETAPVIHSEHFLVDFGPTPLSGRTTWLAQFRAALAQVTPIPGLPIPVEVVASGKTGRTVLRIWAPDPTAVVYAAEALRDGEGPKVVLL